MPHWVLVPQEGMDSLTSGGAAIAALTPGWNATSRTLTHGLNSTDVSALRKAAQTAFLGVHVQGVAWDAGSVSFGFLMGLGLVALVASVVALVAWVLPWEKSTSEERKPQSMKADPVISNQPHAKAEKPMRVVGGNLLCPTLSIDTELALEGHVTMDAQDTIIDLVGREGGLAARAIISEHGEDPGILLETALHVPVAFVSTKPLQSGNTEALQIRRLRGSGAQQGLFAIVAREPGTLHFMVRRPPSNSFFGLGNLQQLSTSASAEDHFLLAVQGDLQGSTLNIVNKRRHLIGVAQMPADGPCSMRLEPGIDTGLVICAALAAQKMYKPTSGQALKL